MEAQLLLMQRLSSQLQAHPGGQAGGSSASDEAQWQEILQLWQEVAVLFHSLKHVLHDQWHHGRLSLMPQVKSQVWLTAA